MDKLKNKPMLLGLTGSMAAGKSTAALLLRACGLPVLDADEAAHGALESADVKERLVSLFGAGILDGAGAIDRKKLASVAFLSDEATNSLNSAVHPAVKHILLEKASALLATARYPAVVLDVPLLFESGLDKSCDRVLVIAASDETRYLRIMLRDGLTRAQAERRVKKQLPQEDKLARADAFVMNDGTLFELAEGLERALAAVGLDAALLPKAPTAAAAELFSKRDRARMKSQERKKPGDQSDE